jgi:hypothetical protein
VGRGRVTDGRARAAVAALAALAVLAGAAPAANAISYRKWEAGTCVESSCKDAGSASQFYTQAAGHPDFGITDFEFNYREEGLLVKSKIPDGHVLNVRVDLPAGLGVNPEATEQCTEAQLRTIPVQCPAGSQVGEDEAVGTAQALALLPAGQTTVTEHFPVFNMERREGQPARFGVKIDSANLDLLATLPGGKDLRSVAFLEGGISWHGEAPTAESSGVASGDYHEFFRIPNLPQEPEIIESRLIFWGRPHEHNPAAANNAFITLPSSCDAKQVTWIHVDSYEEPGTWVPARNETPVTATGCTTLPFSPSFGVNPVSSQSDAPDGAFMDLHVPQFINEPTRTSSPEVFATSVALPEGMTLNPSAAHGLEGCPSINGPCPPGSRIGTFSVNAPGIPPGALSGGVYVGAPENMAPESGGMYRIFLVGEAPRYGVGLRLEGRVSANQQTGRLTATFSNTPEVPFEDIAVQFNGGPRAPLANPLGCGPAAASVAVTPYGGEAAKAAGSAPFSVGGCLAPLPFALSQSAPAGSPSLAGAYAPYNFALTRGDGNQYLQRVQTTLPPGLLGAIPAVPLCNEPAANAGTCPAASKIGTVSVAAGSGSEPYAFSGNAYLTSSYNGAPYGLSVVVPAVAGPYNLGNVVTRAALTVGIYDGRVTATSTLPTVVGGVPLRLRSLDVDVNRRNWIFNPTSCAPLSTGSTLTSTLGMGAPFSSPFQVGGCDKLRFSPSFTFLAGGHPSKPAGTSLEVTVTQSPHEADIKQVLVQLPAQLPSRLTTLQKACPVASFEAGPPPGRCPATSQVGTASVQTPVLPGTLGGPAYLVSHGGEAFPDLDVILRGDGIEVVLVGHTHISSSGVTTSNFETLPDVPISSFALTLPAGSNSVLTSNKQRLCGLKMFAPATIVAHSGARLTPKLPVLLAGCGLQVLSHRISHGKLLLTVLVPEGGTLTVSGKPVRTVRKRASKAAVLKVSVPLNHRGHAALRRRGRGLIVVRVGFVGTPSHKRSAVTVKQRVH